LVLVVARGHGGREWWYIALLLALRVPDAKMRSEVVLK
jgi:hypothetical protein